MEEMKKEYKYKCDRCDNVCVIDGTEDLIYESLYYIAPTPWRDGFIKWMMDQQLKTQ